MWNKITAGIIIISGIVFLAPTIVLADLQMPADGSTTSAPSTTTPVTRLLMLPGDPNTLADQQSSENSDVETNEDGISLLSGEQSLVQYPAGPRWIKLADNSTVYFVNSKSIKIPQLTAQVFLSYHSKWSDIEAVGQEEFDYYPDAKYIRLNAAGAIYRVSGGVKHFIPAAIWNSAGIDPSQIISVNLTFFRAYKTGLPIHNADELNNL